VHSVGVSNRYLNSAELYDSTSGAWTLTSSMADSRSSFTTTVLQDGTVLVVGGLGSAGYLTSAEIYQP